LKQFRLGVNRADWPDNLPPHLLARFLLHDHDGKEVAAGRDLATLAHNLQTHKNSEAIDKKQADPRLEEWRRCLTRQWAFASLPETISLYGADGGLRGLLFSHLTVSDDQGAVRVEFAASLDEARAENRRGLALLYRLQFADGWKALKKYASTAFSGPSVLALFADAPFGQALFDKLLFRVLITIFPCDGGIPDEKSFAAAVAKVKEAGFFALGRDLCDRLLAALRLRREITTKTATLAGKGAFMADKRALFHELLCDIAPPDLFAREEPLDIPRIERQLKSLAMRLERFILSPAKDEEKARQLAPFLPLAAKLAAKRAGGKNSLRHDGPDFSAKASELAASYLAMVDEFRIALFSPEMKTLMPVSAKRLTELRQQLATHGLAA